MSDAKRKRLDPIERLAMRICWMEFREPRSKKRLGFTEREYWDKVRPLIGLERIDAAKRMLWELQALHESDSSVEILEAARDHYEEQA